MRELTMRPFVPSKNGLTRLTRDNSKLLREVEEKTEAHIVERDGMFQIEGEGGSEWIAEQILRALDAGFLPERAFKLLNDEWFLEEVDLDAAMRGSERGIKRQKARIIGQGGKAKKTIEEISGAYLSISGNRVAILGRFEDLQGAKEAVLQLLEGKPHASVFSQMERKRRAEKIAAYR